MRDCDRLLAVAGALLGCALAISNSHPLRAFVSATATTTDRLVGQHAHLTSERIPQSVIASHDLPLVDITTEKIPNGMTERGTSFYIGNDLWLSARHVINDECGRVIMIVDGKNVDAKIEYIDENSDLAALKAPIPQIPALPIETAEIGDDDVAYMFGFPQGIRGGTAGSYLGRTRLKLGGFLSGSAPVLAWTETSRYPTDLDSIAGISGGPVIDEKGYVVGVIVAASVRRGRDYSVAPEILLDTERRLIGTHHDEPTPVRDLVTPPVDLPKSVATMSNTARIVEAYCIPP